MSAQAGALPAERPLTFTKVYNDVIDHHRLRPPELALYTAIARHINQQTGLAWPSISRLCEMTNMARATVVKYLYSLEAKGLIQIIRRRRPGTHERAVNHYRLLDPRPASDSPDSTHPAEGGSSRSELPVVHPVNYPGADGEPRVVQTVDGNQNDLNKTHHNYTKPNQRGPARSAGEGAARKPAAPENGAAPQKEGKHPDKKENWRVFCHKLADICRLDFEANKGKIRRFASKVWPRYTADDLQIFEAWWYKNDWRGKKGDIPRLDEVVATIQIAREDTERALKEQIDGRYRYIQGEYAAYIQY